MALSAVELYERLKPQLGEHETKSLIEYVDEKIRGEVATKEDIHLVKEELRREIQGVRDELRGDIQKLREEMWKLRLLVVVVLVVVVVLNPKVLELVGRVIGMGK